MRKYFKLSAIALLTTAVSGLPAHALSLNLGGNGPLLDLGNGNDANATVSVDTGNLLVSSPANDNVEADAAVQVNLNNVLGGNGDTDGGVVGGIINDGGDGGVVNLGGNGGLVNLGDIDDSDDGFVDIEIGSTGQGSGGLLDLGGAGSLLNLGSDGGLLDLNGEGSVIADLAIDGEGGLLDLGDSDLIDLDDLGLGGGPLLDLSGDPGVDALVEIDIADLDLLDPGSTGSIGGLLDLGEGDLLDLGGDTQDLVALNLLGTTVDADVNLGGGSEPIVDVNIGTGDDGVAGTGLLPDTDVDATAGGDNLATVTVTSGDDGAGGSGGNGGTGSGGNGSGGSGGGGGNGAGSGAGGLPPAVGGGMAPGNGGSSGGGSSSAGIDLAAVDAAACLTLSSAQLDELIKRHTYNRATFNSWASAQSLKIVEVDLCDREIADVAAAVGASTNVARLQAFLAAQAKVRAGLQSKGFAPGDVIAVDHNGEILTVYVI